MIIYFPSNRTARLHKLPAGREVAELTSFKCSCDWNSQTPREEESQFLHKQPNDCTCSRSQARKNTGTPEANKWQFHFLSLPSQQIYPQDYLAPAKFQVFGVLCIVCIQIPKSEADLDCQSVCHFEDEITSDRSPRA